MMSTGILKCIVSYTKYFKLVICLIISTPIYIIVCHNLRKICPCVNSLFAHAHVVVAASANHSALFCHTCRVRSPLYARATRYATPQSQQISNALSSVNGKNKLKVSLSETGVLFLYQPYVFLECEMISL